MAMPLATPTDLPRDFMDTMMAMGDAEAEPGYGYATSYTHRSPQGLHGYY